MSFVYLATVNGLANFCKIGISEDVPRRMQELTNAPDSFGEHKVAYSRRVENCKEIEEWLHEKFNFCRLSSKKEYFLISWQAVKPALEKFPEERGEFFSNSDIVPSPSPDEFLVALQHCNIQTIKQMIMAGMDMNLDVTYGWPDLLKEPVAERSLYDKRKLYIGKLFAQNPQCLMEAEGRPIIEALMFEYIRKNPGINNTPIFRNLGIRTAAVAGGQNDMFTFGILKRLERQGRIINRGGRGEPRWYIVNDSND